MAGVMRNKTFSKPYKEVSISIWFEKKKVFQKEIYIYIYCGFCLYLSSREIWDVSQQTTSTI